MEGRKKIDLKQRSSLRGLKKCAACGELYGQRSNICGNKECELRKKMLANARPFEPVQLVHYSSCMLFSLRCKEKELNRNFVQITEIPIYLETTNASIISKNATCFVETCKQENKTLDASACKHIKACTLESGKSPLPKAEVYTVSKEILFNLNISLERKNAMWDMYVNEKSIPAVQRVNSNTFVVTCRETKEFPAGRLHVIVYNNGLLMKKNNYPCKCMKLKIIVDDDNSVVMQGEICDHVLLVFAAILSHPHGRKNFNNFINSMKAYYTADKVIEPTINLKDDFFKDFGDGYQDKDDSIFIFDENFFTNEVNLIEYNC